MTASGKIHISMAADQSFVLPLAVSLSSLALAHEEGECHVTILHTGVSPLWRERMSQSVEPRLSVQWVDIDDRAVRGAHHSTFLTPASLFRLLLPTVLPSSVTRTLYLDADTVFLTNLRDLWSMDLGEGLVGAVRDANSPWAAGPAGPDWKSLGLDPEAPYFNSGLLLIPLSAWRRHDIASPALDLLRDTRPRWGDQDALNAVLQDRWVELPRRWNLQTADAAFRGIAWALWRADVESAIRDPSVVHFTERDKPWQDGSRHPYRHLWFEHLDRSFLRGWRPPKTARPLYLRVGSRLKRLLND